MSDVKEKFETLEEFWPFYLSEHKSDLNKGLHFIGAVGSLFWISRAIAKKKPSLLLNALISGYGFAWIGHFFVEKNKPASFKYPAKSFVSDWLMFSTILTGKIKEEVKKAEEYERIKLLEESKY